MGGAPAARAIEMSPENSVRYKHSYIKSMLPAHHTPEGHSAGAVRMLGFKHDESQTSFLKAITVGNNVMVAQAKCNTYYGVVPTEFELDGEY